MHSADFIPPHAIRILLVAVNTPFLSITTGILSRHSEMDVVGIARGCEQALAQARSLRPQVILLDLEMPEKTGMEIITHLRDSSVDIPIIVLSLLDPESYRKAVLEAGANEMIQKLDLSTTLVPAIRRAVQEDHRSSE